jgi:hypothetical protein
MEYFNIIFYNYYPLLTKDQLSNLMCVVLEKYRVVYWQLHTSLDIHKSRRGRDRMVLPMQSVPITTDVVGSTPAHGEVYIMW